MSLAPFILRRPWLTKMLQPVASWYVGATGYRKLGLRYDDLLEEEREDVSVALKRLSPKEAYERIYRIRRATQCSVQHKLLPRNEWTKPDQDIRYLQPLVEQVAAEFAEKNALDSAEIVKKH